MSIRKSTSEKSRSRRSRGTTRRPLLEVLENRCLPSASSGLSLFQQIAEAEPNDTLDRANLLAVGAAGQYTQAHGTVGNGLAGTSDVDWYAFTLGHAATVQLDTSVLLGMGPAAAPLSSVISLFNDDLGRLSGHRLLAQNDSGQLG